MRKAALLVFVVIIMSLIAFGCAPKEIVSETTVEPQQETPPQQVTPGDTEGDLNIEAQEVEPTEAAKPGLDLEGEGLSNIYFDFDSYAIQDQFKDQLMTLSNRLLESDASVLVEGHCDDRGTNEYNLALGDRRAKAIKDFIKAAGVPASRIETISFGEEKPVCTEQAEDCWSQNRRAHVVAEGGK